MTFQGQLLTAGGFACLLLALGVADATVNKDRIDLQGQDGTDDFAFADDAKDLVTKQRGPDIAEVLTQLGISAQTTGEQSLLRRVIADRSINVQSRVLLQQNDRIAFFSWTESPQVKTFFQALKEALHESFSPQLTGLLDETQTPDNAPARNVLTFRDPAIHEDQVLFIRVRERLYEFHIVNGQEAEVQALVEELSK